MDAQLIGVLATIFLLLAPVIAISYTMTAKSKRVKAGGFFGLSGFLFLVSIGCFAMAASGENRAGYAWMAIAVYGSYWAWTKAKSIREE